MLIPRFSFIGSDMPNPLIEKYTDEIEELAHVVLVHDQEAHIPVNLVHNVLRRFGRELIEECVPERVVWLEGELNIPSAVRQEGFNHCRTAVLDKARELIGE